MVDAPVRIRTDGGHVPDFLPSQSRTNNANPTELATNVASGIREGFSPAGFVERTTQTLFHPAPPSTGAGNMPTIDVGGSAQAAAAAAKTQFTQAWGQFTSVFSTPLSGNPGNNPGGVNVTKTSDAPTVADVAGAQTRGGGRRLFGDKAWWKTLFPNG